MPNIYNWSERSDHKFSGFISSDHVERQYYGCSNPDTFLKLALAASLYAAEVL